MPPLGFRSVASDKRGQRRPPNMEDRSLDEFLDAGESDESDADGTEVDVGGAESDSGGDGGECPSEEQTGAGPVESVEPAVSTCVRDPAGGTCAACEESVERRWRGEAGLVCPGCKEW